jgi:hypothetical protein
MIAYEDLCAALDQFNRHTPSELHSEEKSVDLGDSSLSDSSSNEATAGLTRGDEPSRELDVGDVMSDDLA